MRALVMAAGLGTRLRPLTEKTPKPLVPLAGRPMVAHVLDLLARHGFSEALINIHYFPEQMRAFVRDWNQRGAMPKLEIQDESAAILGSGGAVRLGLPWLFAKEESALVCNADVLATPDLAALATTHARLRGEGVECTLAYQFHEEAGRKYNGLRVKGERVVSFDRPGHPSPDLFQFPGFYVIDRKVAEAIPPGVEISIVESAWHPLAVAGKLGAFCYRGAYHDLGTVEDLRAAEEFLAESGN